MRRSRPDLTANPIIAAVKNEAQMERALKTDCEVVFLLFGDILNVADLTARVRAAGKHPIVHLDLVNGLGNRDVAADFIAGTTGASGVISTRPAVLKRAKELGLFTVLRVFAIDSMAFENIRRQREAAEPDVVEILPGLMPTVIQRVCAMTDIPVIAGGLLSEKKDVLAALDAGAVAVSTTNEALWNA